MHTCFHLGVKLLIFNDKNKILLLKRDHPIKKIYWDIPGGRVQKGETPLQTLKREVKEETGLKSIDPLQAVTTALTDILILEGGEEIGLIFSIFRCDLSSSFSPTLSREHQDFAWQSPKEATVTLGAHYPAELIEYLELLTLKGSS